MSDESRDRARRNRPGEGAGGRLPAAAPTPSRRQPHPASALPEVGALTLPAGALVALRKSGGLVFRSREIIVYDDGRVGTSAVGGGRSASIGEGRTLGREELAALRQVLDGVDFGQLPVTVGQQRPDAFVYEVAALVDGTPHAVEVADGQIPATVAPLIRRLGKLLASAG